MSVFLDIETSRSNPRIREGTEYAAVPSQREAFLTFYQLIRSLGI